MTRELIDAIIRRLDWRRSFVLPNYTPNQWWECDVFEVTKAGYFREYEVKMTRSDFMADRNKGRTISVRQEQTPDGLYTPWKREKLNKWELLARSDARCPTRFTYVTPPGLLTLTDLPPWAGLIEARVDSEGKFQYLRDMVKAPKLHAECFAAGRMNHALRNAYCRMHEMAGVVRRLTARLNAPVVHADKL